MLDSIKIECIQSNNQLINWHFSSEGNQKIQGDINATEFEGVCMLVDGDLIQSLKQSEEGNTLKTIIENRRKNIPVFSSHDLGLDLEDLDNKSHNEINAVTAKMYRLWCLHNNFAGLENIYPLIMHLRKLWKENREEFAKDLWTFLKLNLGVTEARLVYQDVDDNPESPKLIPSYVIGTTDPKAYPGNDIEERLLEAFKHATETLMNIESYKEESGELTMTLRAEKSPLLFMGKTFSAPSSLQLGLIRALLKGLE